MKIYKSHELHSWLYDDCNKIKDSVGSALVINDLKLAEELKIELTARTCVVSLLKGVNDHYPSFAAQVGMESLKSLAIMRGQSQCTSSTSH